MELIVHWLATVMETAGVGIIVAGAVIATIAFLKRCARKEDFADSYQWYRTSLGRAILLGLEFLVAADIIGTVAVDPTFRSLGVLALIILIRTFLSFSLEVEISGKLPWQKGMRSANDKTDLEIKTEGK